jgi:hypothetical protein
MLQMECLPLLQWSFISLLVASRPPVALAAAQWLLMQPMSLNDNRPQHFRGTGFLVAGRRQSLLCFERLLASVM